MGKGYRFGMVGTPCSKSHSNFVFDMWFFSFVNSLYGQKFTGLALFIWVFSLGCLLKLRHACHSEQWDLLGEDPTGEEPTGQERLEGKMDARLVLREQRKSDPS